MVKYEDVQFLDNMCIGFFPPQVMLQTLPRNAGNLRPLQRPNIGCAYHPADHRLHYKQSLDYPLVNIQKSIENGHLWLILPLKFIKFHTYVSFPKGK
jgi:hypothetical protein